VQNRFVIDIVAELRASDVHCPRLAQSPLGAVAAAGRGGEVASTIAPASTAPLGGEVFVVSTQILIGCAPLLCPVGRGKRKFEH